MKESLKELVKELFIELNRCIEIDNELTENRSDNYYYFTRAELLRKIIYDLNNIIKGD